MVVRLMPASTNIMDRGVEPHALAVAASRAVALPAEGMQSRLIRSILEISILAGSPVSPYTSRRPSAGVRGPARMWGLRAGRGVGSRV